MNKNVYILIYLQPTSKEGSFIICVSWATKTYQGSEGTYQGLRPDNTLKLAWLMID